jgi:hypothetical protein
MTRHKWLFPLALMLAASSLPGPALAQNPGGAKAGAPPAVEPELPASDLLVRYEGPALSFRWSLAPEASLEPALVREMRGEALAERAKAIREAEADNSVSQPGGRRAPYEWIERWSPTAETDLLLGFSGEQYRFTGGAHGNLVLRGIIWDRGANRRIAFSELFQNPAAATAAMKPAFCKALDAERAQRRGGQVGNMFDDCPDFTAYAIVPLGDGEISAFRVLVPPYEAGPWAEGSYEIMLDASLVKAYLLPRYAPVFTKS